MISGGTNKHANNQGSNLPSDNNNEENEQREEGGEEGGAEQAADQKTNCLIGSRGPRASGSAEIHCRKFKKKFNSVSWSVCQRPHSDEKERADNTCDTTLGTLRALECVLSFNKLTHKDIVP